MKRISSFIITMLLGLSAVYAEQMPQGYYANADGLNDEELKTALYNIIRVGSRMDYGTGSWTIFYYSDRREDGSVWDMYSDEKRYFSTPGEKVSGMNIEHSFAKSWWGGSKNDAYKDCYHLNPSDTQANSIRSNYPLGNVTDVTAQAGTIKVGTNSEYGSFKIWEPKDEYKGDFARAYFYMATCYQNLTWRVDNQQVGSINAMQNDDYLEFQDWERELLLAWHRQDPVSEKEIKRMDAVSDYQHNRNPFIEYPCLVEYIWGNKRGEKVDLSTLRNSSNEDWLSLEDKSGCQCVYTEPTLIQPSKSQVINVGSANRGSLISTTFVVKGAELTKDLTLSISGDDADLFSLSTKVVTAKDALEGASVRIDYMPDAFGEHNTILNIQSEEVSRDIPVNGICQYIFQALPATDIYESGFLAHWTDAEVDNYELDVYTKTVKGGAIETVLDLTEITSESISDYSNISTSGKIYWETQKNALRLGTSNGTGSMTISGLNLGTQASITIKASQYGSDASSVLSVNADGVTIEDISLGAETKEYTVDLPEGTKSISLVQKNNKQRVILYALRITQGGTTTTISHIEGYPREVGNVLEYDVNVALKEGDKLYYTVKPNGKDKSNEVEVIATFVNTSTEYLPSRKGLFIEGQNVTILGVQGGEQIKVYDSTGRLLINDYVHFDRETIILPQTGFYLMQIDGEAMKVIINK